MKRRGELTRRKLEEAEFFLGHLRPNYNKDRKFDFYLSAFISAARSVTWAMKAEYSKVPGWKEWSDAHNSDSDEARLLKGTRALRNRTQKRGALKTLSKVKVAGLSFPNASESPSKEILERVLREGVPAKIGGTPGKYTLEFVFEGEPIVLFAKQLLFKRGLEEFPDENILDVCDKYFKVISTLVANCEARFDT